jgi:hypothetical protein
MKKLSIYLFVGMISSSAYSQVLIDKPIQLSGSNASDRMITNLSAPVAGTDAVNKDYVDAQIATVSGGGGSSMPSMMSNEATALSFSGAVQYCKNLVESSFSDWRLPTIDELVYFVGDPGVSTNYLWTKSLAPGKENPVNQNYMTLRLTDGKWRNGGEVTGLLLARTAVGAGNNIGSFTTVATLTPLTAGNVIMPSHVKLSGVRSGTGSASGNCDYRLKFNFADGSSSYSSVFSQNSTTTTVLIDAPSIPLLTSVTPLNSIDIEVQSTSGYTGNGTLVISGYETSMTQGNTATLVTRCVR